MKTNMPRSVNRREFLAAGTGGLLWAAARESFGSYKVGLQSYCFNDLDLDNALSRMHSLGLRYTELFEGHLSPKSSDAEIAAAKRKLKAMDVTALGIYTEFPPDEAKARQIFEFARKMGFRFVNGAHPRESLPLLETLAPRYDIEVAIHNHGPGSLYDKLVDVTSALQQYKRLRACVDIGHFARSGVNPTHAIETIGRRAVELHVKDLAENNENRVVGTGRIDMRSLFGALKKVRFDGLLSLEYEGDWDNLEARMEGMRASLRNMQKLIAEK
jgi:inosose dehydratase